MSLLLQSVSVGKAAPQELKQQAAECRPSACLCSVRPAQGGKLSTGGGHSIQRRHLSGAPLLKADSHVFAPFSSSSHAPAAPSAQGQLVCLLVASQSLLPLQCCLALRQTCYSLQSIVCQPCNCDIASSEHRCAAGVFSLTDLCGFKCLVSRQLPLLQLCNVLLRANVHRLTWAPCAGQLEQPSPRAV